MKQKMRFATKVIHANLDADPATGAVMTPIYQTSTYRQSSPGKHQGYEYSRSSNPSRSALEANIAALENGEHAFCFGSGMAAIDAVMKIFKPGDEVLVSQDLYGGTYRLFTNVFEKFGIKFRFVSLADPKRLNEYLSAQTKMVWVETPTNPLMSILDLEAIANITKTKGIYLAVDNTFATPYLQRPLEWGADIVMHSITKYLGGHSDVVMGALVCHDSHLAEKLHFIQKSSGAIPGPQDCFLALRGIKTLHLRMQRHCENARAMAEHLKSIQKIDQLYWPGFETHPNHHVAAKQMKDFGGMIAFSLKEDTVDSAHAVLSKFKLITLAESLGGVESLACHPATMTHAAMSKAQRLEIGVVDSLIRLSVGVEDVRDLKEDVSQALN